MKSRPFLTQLSFFVALVLMLVAGVRVADADPTKASKPDARRTDARFSQGDPRLAQMETSLSELVNAQRAKAGLKPLAYDDALADVARAHSLEMRDQKYFAHISPSAGLKTAVDRYRKAFDSVPPVVAENLYGAWGGKSRELCNDDILRTHDSLMRSFTHRQNILCADLTHIGIGLVTNAKGDIWLTQMFICAKRSAE